MSKRTFRFIFISLFVCLGLLRPGLANAFNSWTEIAAAMETSLNKAYEAYFMNDVDDAKKWVNDAYFTYYEKEGFERTVMAYISGKRGSEVEYQFSIIKKMMTEGRPNLEVRGNLDTLIKWLKEDANQLDGKEENPWGVFFAALFIILREGVEAIIVIAAIAAYLKRSGNGDKNKTVYASAVAAVLVSILAAIGLQYVFNISGASQEILEGIAMLLATVVLFFVSNWMFSKATATAWQGYIEGKIQSAVKTGSAFALGAAAFLAVFREGAETILFYQAMFADVETNTGMIWAGFGLGCIGLVIIYIIIRYGSLKLPIKPFFIGTSILMYILAIVFAGGGIKELQEGDVIGVSPVKFISSIDWLGIYPTLETLLPQVVLVILALLSIGIYTRKYGTKSIAAKIKDH